MSPWLERTRWLHYLKGIPLDRAARLARLPKQHDELVLYEVGLAVDRLVEAAYLSLCEEKRGASPLEVTTQILTSVRIVQQGK